MFFALVFSIPWDIFAVTNHLWFFPKEGNIGFLILGLPIEEYLFMTTVTLLIGSITILVKYRKA
jgi:lycopene cyclase domain-containing protein